MKTSVQFVNLDRSPYVEELLMKKLNKLSKKYDWIIMAHVFFKLEKGSVGKGKINKVKRRA